MALTYIDLGNNGRLGNSFFQASAVIALACRNNDSYIFPRRWVNADFYNIDSCFSDNIRYHNEYIEPHFHYCAIPYRSEMNLKGYFQSWRYFDDHQDIIKFLLSPKQPFPTAHNTASIHIRRGDYITLGNSYYINLAATDYYERAMNIIKAEKYYVFSDDINWCKTRFIGDQFLFIEGNQPHIDLALMSSCEAGNICANSSFSWWGGYLNPNPNKVVIAPLQWFGPNLPHDTKDLIPPTWVRI